LLKEDKAKEERDASRDRTLVSTAI